MNTAPYLLPEDRPEFEQALDEALAAPRSRPAPTAGAGSAAASGATGADGPGPQVGSEQLRAMALGAVTAIAACAAAEYQRYVALREASRGAPSTASAPVGTAAASTASATDDTSGTGSASGAGGTGEPAPDRAEEGAVAEGTAVESGGHLASTVGEAAETAGAGLLAMASVLLPVLAGTAAVIFLLLGYLLHIATPEPTVAAPMRSVGWVFAGLAAVSLAVGLTGLWITALRNGTRSRRADRDGPRTPGDGVPWGPQSDLDAAREAWREALLERGILPFLNEALADPKGAQRTPESYVPAPRDAEPPHDEHRTPRLGYSGPEFSSRTAKEEAEAEPRGGPGHGRDRTVGRGENGEDGDSGENGGNGGSETSRPPHAGPDYSSPDYAGPEFDGPEFDGPDLRPSHRPE